MPAVTRNPEPALGLVLHWDSSSILCCCRGSTLFPSFATFPFAYCTHPSKLGVFIYQNIIKYGVIHESLHVVIMGCNFRRWLCQHCLFIFIEWYCSKWCTEEIIYSAVKWFRYAHCTSYHFTVFWRELGGGRSESMNTCLWSCAGYTEEVSFGISL